jgi:photosystem II stability/assembly factor-like uncharacterized protein
MRVALLLLLAATTQAQDFRPQTSHTKSDLRGVSAVSTTITWASGTKGTFLRTTDGGQTWTPSTVPGAEALDFRDIEAFNENVAFLLAAGPGNNSRIYKTADAGAHWTLQLKNEAPRGFYDCMAFWDEKHGILIGDAIEGEFQLFATDDGEHWHQLPTNKLPTSLEGEGAFAASGTCITVQGDSNVWFATGGKAARVFRSTDRGQTWQVTETPITHGADTTGIFSVAFRDAKNGVIAGGDYQVPKKNGPNLAFTDNGGETWKLATLTPQFYYSAAGFTSSGLLLAGTSGAAFASSEALASPAASPLHAQFLNLNAISIAPDGTAFAVGPKGLIARRDASK